MSEMRTADGKQQPLRVMLVEDHAMVRSAIRQAISAPDIEVVAEATTGEEALLRAPAVRPDVLLLDIDLPGLSGLQALRELAPRLPDTKIVMLTASSAQRDLFGAVRSGASGYLTKDMTPEALQRAIRGTRVHDLPMPRAMAAQVVEHLARASGSASTAAETLAGYGLSEREEEVLQLLADGLTDREIGTVLTISPRTVETHVSRILGKLGVRNRAEAARLYRDAT